MKIKMTTLAMRGCLAAATLCPMHARSEAAPEIRVAADTFEFGTVTVGTVVRATFVLTNAGAAPLEIVDVRPTCGCTTAGAWPRWLEPGTNATLRLQLNTADFGGPLSKAVTVTCNDPKRPTVTLLINGQVWKPFDVQPRVVMFSPGAWSPNGSVRVARVVNNTEEMITLEEPQSSNPAFRPTFSIITPGKVFEFQIALSPSLPAGAVQGLITAKTSAANLPPVTFTAMAIIPPAVAAIPSQVLLPSGPLTQPLQLTVVIRNNTGAPLAVSNPCVSGGNVGASLRETQAGQLYDLVLDFPAGFDLKPGTGASVVVSTSHPQTPLVTVPIVRTPALP